MQPKKQMKTAIRRSSPKIHSKLPSEEAAQNCHQKRKVQGTVKQLIHLTAIFIV